MDNEKSWRHIIRYSEIHECNELKNDKEQIRKRIRSLEIHLEELKDILEKEDF